jgi:hypothetical protein
VLEDGTTTLDFDTNSFSNCPIESLYLGRNISYYSSSSPFRNTTALTSLTIGNSVTSIGYYAFYGCTGLKDVVLEDGTTTLDFATSSSIAFQNCPIESLYLGRNISYSSSYSPFSGKTTLTSLTIGNSVTSIGSSAFSGCTLLKELYVNNTTPAIISENTFPGNIILIKTYIPKESFVAYFTTDIWKEMYLIGRDNAGILYNLTQVYLEEGNSIITVNNEDSEYVISKADEDIAVSLKNGVNNYHIVVNGVDLTSALQKNNDITFIPRNINHIHTYQFAQNNKFVIRIGNSGTLIDSIGVANVNNVKDLIVSGNLNGTDILTIRKLTNLVSLDMSNANIVAGGESYYQTYTTSANTIGNYFFKEKDNLALVLLPNTVTTINSDAFESCIKLKYIVIPKSITSIGSYVFSGCTGLKKVVL